MKIKETIDTTKTKLKLDLDYQRNKQQEKELSSIGLSSNYIHFAVAQVHQQGLKGQLRRVWGRLQRKLESAVQDNLNSIILDEDEQKLVISSFADVSFPPDLAKYVIVLEDEIEKL